MKKLIVTSLMLLIGIVGYMQPSTNQVDENTSLCSVDNFAFSPGEKIVYKMYYNVGFVWMSAGEVVFNVEEENDTYHLSLWGHTYKSYEWFYKVNDHYDCWVDKNTLKPIYSVRTAEEGDYRLYDKLEFDYDNNNVISWRGDYEEDAKRKEYEITECTHDMLSIVYATRNSNLVSMEKGDKLPLSIFMDKNNYNFGMKYVGKKSNKKIKKLGKFDLLQFQPELVEGDLFDKNDKMNVWVTNDENRIPIMVESPLSVGSIKIILKEYSGLRNDFTAKID